MAYDFIIYARASALPAAHRLADMLAATAPGLALCGRLPDPARRSGPVRVHVATTTVELGVRYGDIDADEAGDFEADVTADGEPLSTANAQHLEILRVCDLAITVTARPGAAVDIARTVSTALASACRGYLCDPQLDVVLGPPIAAAPPPTASVPRGPWQNP